MNRENKHGNWRGRTALILILEYAKKIRELSIEVPTEYGFVIDYSTRIIEEIAESLARGSKPNVEYLNEKVAYLSKLSKVL